ncbi:class I tRNA ligase family protein [Actinokineospora enzanensis]|uniref:class I tRNA ligase family protein n=1 Tax=Actinokineospora enzanensis TaxID=155975 RepID=UPI00037454DA|nr:class I tRNA ligase family protein [Actinokineospora enzanensis]
MITSVYDHAALSAAFGIDMADIPGLGVGAGWGRVPPGGRSDPHQHDEVEVFVIVRGHGHLVVDGARRPVTEGTVALFEPFETHVVANTGDTDLVFTTFYWRDQPRAARRANRTVGRGFDRRPVFVFSTPPTPNGDLHLGHLSGPYLGADAYVRFQRMNGVRAWHLTGSDDFQSYVQSRARKDGTTPAETARRFSTEIAATLRLMDIEPDQYTVTTADPDYPPALTAFFRRLLDSGRVAPQDAPALFDAETGEYLYECDVHGLCPTCKAVTGGNICEECGEPNQCVDLVAPVSNRSDRAPRQDSARRYSLPLHEFREEIRAHHNLGRVPARLRELADRVLARDEFHLPVSHPSSWGVPTPTVPTAPTAPTAPAVPVSDGPEQVVWVWPEMAFGFLHGIQALGGRLGEDWQADRPSADWKIVHFFGYDNSFYHSVLYPALYRLAHPDWEPDIDYHVNEFYLLDGEKFSTSRGHAIWGKELLGPDTVDAVRFHVARTRPEGRRTDFRLADYHAVVRDTLIGRWQHWLTDLGARVAEQYGGRAPDAGIWTPEHTALLGRLRVRLAAVTTALGADGFSLNAAAAELDGIVDDVLRFSLAERAAAGIDHWGSQNRTAIALELAAARLLGRVAAPLMPRFAAGLAAALSDDEPDRWPSLVDLVPAGTPVDLADRIFFGSPTPSTPPGGTRP